MAFPWIPYFCRQVMEVVHDISVLKNLVHPIVTIGTYDGVHLGHQKIIRRIIDKARESHRKSILITFDNHPRKVLMGDSVPLLSTLEEKAELLKKLGLDYMLVISFNQAFASKSALDFIQEYLIDHLNIGEIVIGHDHQFGNKREGNMQLLKEVLLPMNRIVSEISAEEIDEVVVSSSKIRNALAMGEVGLAKELLGYAYFLQGEVVLGNQLGRTLGYPTANLAIQNPDKLIPANGVYAVEVEHLGVIHRGMMNIGFRPTVEKTLKRALEVHLFDFNSDIYGKTLKVHFLRKVREEVKFADLPALKNQLAIDEKNIRDLFSLV